MSRLIVKKKKKEKTAGYYIDEQTDKINEYIRKYCKVLEKGIQGYDFSIGEYKEVQYGDGNGFEEIEVWFEDHNVPTNKEKPYTEFDEIDDLIEHIKEQLK